MYDSGYLELELLKRRWQCITIYDRFKKARSKRASGHEENSDKERGARVKEEGKITFQGRSVWSGCQSGLRMVLH